MVLIAYNKSNKEETKFNKEPKVKINTQGSYLDLKGILDNTGKDNSKILFHKTFDTLIEDHSEWLNQGKWKDYEEEDEDDEEMEEEMDKEEEEMEGEDYGEFLEQGDLLDEDEMDEDEIE